MVEKSEFSLSNSGRAHLKGMIQDYDLNEKQARRRLILLALDEGADAYTLAKQYGVSETMIYYLIQRYRKRGWMAVFHGKEGQFKVRADLPEIRRLSAIVPVLTDKEIGEKVGLADTTIQRLRTRYGIGKDNKRRTRGWGGTDSKIKMTDEMMNALEEEAKNRSLSLNGMLVECLRRGLEGVTVKPLDQFEVHLSVYIPEEVAAPLREIVASMHSTHADVVRQMVAEELDLDMR